MAVASWCVGWSPHYFGSKSSESMNQPQQLTLKLPSRLHNETPSFCVKIPQKIMVFQPTHVAYSKHTNLQHEDWCIRSGSEELSPSWRLDPYSSGSCNSAEEVFHQNMRRMANMAFTPCFLEDLGNTSPIPFEYIYIYVCGLQYEPSASRQKVFNTSMLVGGYTPWN